MRARAPRAFALASLLGLLGSLWLPGGCASASSADSLAPLVPSASRANAPVDPPSIPCPLMAREEAFLSHVLYRYREALRAASLGENAFPWTVVVGRECVYQLAPKQPLQGGKYLTTGLMWNARPLVVHAAGYVGELTLPSGARLEPGPYATGRPTSEHERFVLALPELWPEYATAKAEYLRPLVDRAVAELMTLTTP